jgi:hypothetical protein
VSALAGTKSCFSGLILDSAFASYRSLARSKLAGVWLTWPLQWPLSYLVTDEFSPIDAIAQLRVPLLMIHGDRDPVVPLAEGQQLFSAYPHQPKEWWLVPGGGHTAAFGDEASPYRPRLVQWLASHRGP